MQPRSGLGAQNAESFGGDGRRVAVAGDSVGGNLAAVVSLMARDNKASDPCFQLMPYLATNRVADTPSSRDNAEGYLLTKKTTDWF